MGLFTLREESGKPMLIGCIGNSINEGIYEEISEEEIPNQYRIERFSGGMGVFNSFCMRSNTGTVGWKKYFRKVSDIIDFEPLWLEEFKLLNLSTIKRNWLRISKILKDTNIPGLTTYYLSFIQKENGKYRMEAIRTLDNRCEIKPKDHPYREYANEFIDMYKFTIRLVFDELSAKEIAVLTEQYGAKALVHLPALLEIIDTHGLQITNDYYILSQPYYSKNRIMYRSFLR